jgi:CRISPR-associated protein Cas1
MNPNLNPIPLSMLNALVYCPRRFYLEHVEGVFVRNAEVEDGRIKHKRVDRKEKAGKTFKENNAFRTRSVFLSSQAYGICGVIDLVEEVEGVVYPVEYKRGDMPKDDSGNPLAWENDKVQLCAQAFLLEENLNKRIEKGFLYYMGSKEKVEIPIDQGIRERTNYFVGKAKELTVPNTIIPHPLEDDNRCHSCSLRPVCLPEEIYYLRNKGFASHKVMAHLDEGSILYLQEQGSWVNKRGGHFVVHLNGGDEKATVPLSALKQVVVYGNVQLSTQAIETLLEEGIPTAFLSVYGQFKGILSPVQTKSPALRMAQFISFHDSMVRLNLAREIIRSKISNCRVLLMRSLRADDNELSPSDDESVESLKEFIRLTESANSIEELLGIEGSAARIYFQNFIKMLKTSEKFDFDFKERNRRPPKDPVNALLSFGYSLLLKDIMSAISTVGFDPCIGFYHSQHHSRPSLALDMMEEFRPLIADSVVLTLLNKEMITNKDFMTFGKACYLNESGRKKFFETHEWRKNTEIIHPVFGYKVTYTRAMEVQIRMLAALLRGEIDSYIGFKVR